MSHDDSIRSNLRRTFRDLSEKEVADVETASVLVQMGWSGAFSWEELLTSQRILIVSEAGAGKTFECRSRRELLWKAGEPAFYLDLATLARGSVREMLSTEEEERFDAWLRAQSEIATFFLDSIDELKLTLGSFEQALKRLNKAIAGQLGRSRVVITTRPIPVDQRLIRQHLPIPEKSEAGATGEAFANIAMSRHRQKPHEKAESKPWRNVALMPLSDEQIREMAVLQEVTDPDALLADIRRRNAEDFARRPQDLIELCSDWREHHRIRTHCEQVATNAAVKLKPRTDRPEKAELSPARALDGATRLALAAMLTRKLTFRYCAESDQGQATEAALDGGNVLPDWTTEERETLLERPLFGFATYGRVRFHHRSVVEYLAARRLDTLLERGVPMKAVKRLLFTDTAQGERVVRPSMRAAAAWLAIWREGIFAEVRDREPAVLLDYGDPQSLRPSQRLEALQAYVERYGEGGWRGLHVPLIQVHRFASQELAPEVKTLWSKRIENQEVRELLLELVGAAQMSECADIAYDLAFQPGITVRERIVAIETLIALEDDRLPKIASSIESDSSIWPDELAKSAILRLFPKYLAADQLCRILTRVKESKRSVGDLSWQLPRLIAESELSSDSLDTLRERLTTLVTEGAEWKANDWPHVRSKRSHLVSSLVAVCLRQLREGRPPKADLVRSAMLALRLTEKDYGRDEPAQELRHALTKVSGQSREAAFWAEDAFLQALHPQEDIWHRLFELTHHGSLTLNAEQDGDWIRRYLANPKQPFDLRAMMLYAEMNILPPPGGDWCKYVMGLKTFVADSPALLAMIDERLKPREESAEIRRLEALGEKSRKQAERRDAKAHASWVMFWRGSQRTQRRCSVPIVLTTQPGIYGVRWNRRETRVAHPAGIAALSSSNSAEKSPIGCAQLSR
jgi:hypothetical protein